jgi:hypothetical protein
MGGATREPKVPRFWIAQAAGVSDITVKRALASGDLADRKFLNVVAWIVRRL